MPFNMKPEPGKSYSGAIYTTSFFIIEHTTCSLPSNISAYRPDMKHELLRSMGSLLAFKV